MLTNIAAMLEDEIGAALEREMLEGENVFWSATVLPGQNTTTAFVTVAMKGAVVGSVIQSGVFVENPALIDEAGATALARQALEALRTSRSQQLGQTVADSVKDEAVARHPGGVLLG